MTDLYICIYGYHFLNGVKNYRLIIRSLKLATELCNTLRTAIRKQTGRGFPGGSVVKKLPANAGDMGSSSDTGRSHMPRSN